MTDTPGATSRDGARRRRASRPRAAVVALLALLLGLAVGRYACAPPPAAVPLDPRADARDAARLPAPTAEVWTCSMHPQVRAAGPGPCPLCGMDLVPVATDADAPGPRALVLSETAAALADIVTRPVERRAVARQVRMVGRVTFDETRLAYITAWVPSRLDRLFVDYTGVRVRKGDHMVEVYSPQLVATQQELIQAVETQRRLADSPLEGARTRQAATVESARERLRLWGLQPEQIDAIAERGEPLEHVTINSPASGVVVHKNALQGDYVETGTRIYTIADLSRVWVQLDAYESDLAWLHYGQEVRFTTEAWPGETFRGRISFIDPVLDNRTRTVKVRLNVDNADHRLKPDMFVRATVEAPMTAGGRLVDPELADMWMCPMHPEVVADESGACDVCGMPLAPTEELGFRAATAAELPLVVPATAPLVTGTRAVVYVRLPDGEGPTFEGREVTLGPRAGDWYVVREGLAEGEEVVVHGAFKLDSELQIRARPSMMNPAGDAPGAHAHDGNAGGAGGDGDTGAGRGGATDPDGAGGDGVRPDDAVHAPRIGDAPAAFAAQLDELLAAYLVVQTSLASDDDGAAARGAAAVRAAIGGVAATQLTGEAHAAWNDLRPELATGATALADATSIEARRTAFGRLSAALVAALERFGHGRPAELGVFHCPMALGDGADWIAAGTTVANPYYGERMLRCGERVRTLPRRR